ncbi:MAG: hypothetical protein GWP06_04185, partial [Actinobacteria bacterium]|nr:hypothetical protein [Actinomycetota bacterium]
ELRDYDKRIQHEVEATIYGPITSKLDFLLSGRYLKGVNKYPSVLNYNPEFNFQAKLDYQLTSSTAISFSGLYGGYATTGISKTNYWSSEDSPQRARGVSAGQSPGASIQNPYEYYKYMYWIAGGRTGDGIRPPEYGKIYSGQLKLTHVFSPRTYVELKASHFVFNQEMDTLDHLKVKWGGPDWTWPEDKVPPDNELFRTSGYGDFRFNYNDSKNTKIEGSLISQIAPQHLLKMGTGFSYQYFKNIWHEGRSADRIYMSDYIRPIAFHPYEGYAYFQDKIEIRGMVVNAGLRFDFYNANKKVSDDFWDPLRIDKNTPGNRGMSLISFDPNGPYAVKTPTQTVLSPRLGVSFPITESTVLHFMYGHFNMRPAWMKMLADPIEKMEPPPEGVQVTAPIKEEELPIYHDYPTVYTGHQKNVGNPTLEFEKMIQYEVGFDQNIADLLRLDVTLYYKDGKNLTSVGYQKSGMGNMATSSWLATRLYPDDNNPESISVGDMGYNFVYTNGGALDVRGLEATLETKLWRNATFKIIYNMSYANTIRYGLDTVYRLFDDGKKLGRDYLWGASNYDRGVVGNTNQRWNPNNTIKFISYLSTPLRFGPKVSGFHPLGNWHLNIFTMYSSGEKFTYHSPDDFSSEPLNRIWKPRYMTNLKLIKRIKGLGMGFEFSVDVRNVFNNKTLRLMGGKDLEDYMENGKLPTHPLTNEVMEWTMYRRDTMPREVFFGLGITF